eukprot:jgi/Mesen1/3699/ME000202S02783
MAPEIGAGAPPSLPCPGFEGFEKRLEVEFSLPARAGLLTSVQMVDATGLRGIPRSELDTMLTAAQCTIVSQLSNEHFDSYVLSESSLFVYPTKVVIKTCGTTRLLQAIPELLDSAARLNMVARRCKYTRGTFMFPQVQPAPHGSFSDEVKTLEEHFGHLGGGGKAYVMGDMTKFPNWHIYVADAEGLSRLEEPTYTLEMCMTKLDKVAAGQFFQDAGFANAKAVTKASGISGLLPGSQIDDFSFEPCGYSMNSIEMNAHSTIHITPEDGFSYASFETMGYGNAELELGELVKKVAAVFKPGCFSLAVHANGPVGVKGAGAWGGVLPSFEGYSCEGTNKQELPFGSATVFHTYKANEAAFGLESVAPLPLFEAAQQKAAPAMAVDQVVPVVEKQAAESKPAGRRPMFHAQPVLETTLEFGPDAAAVMAAFNASLVGTTSSDMDACIRKQVTSTGAEEPFYVMDLGVVLRLWKTWTSAMPRVQPFYAVKCNPDPALLSLLAALGAGFDVASKSEITAVVTRGVSSERMIYANPCKLPSHITAAAKDGVLRTTFDSESELVKLKKYHPGAHAVLRLRADDRGARCPLGVKYGAELEECEHLLKVAQSLGIHVAGVAFHVGSGAADSQSYTDGIETVRSLFDMAEALGMAPMTLLDIGGGFTSKGGSGMGFAQAATAINEALDEYFPESMGVQIIGEPGRFFAEAPSTLATHVFGTRFRGKGHARKAEYWINDGIYGSMNCLLYDHAELTARPLMVASAGAGAKGGASWLSQKMLPSTIFGPTCDGLDTVLRDVCLPQLECGDWLVFPRMGAYTQAAGTSFNGFDTKDIRTVYVYSSMNAYDEDLSCLDEPEGVDIEYNDSSSDTCEEICADMYGTGSDTFEGVSSFERGESSSGSDDDNF